MGEDLGKAGSLSLALSLREENLSLVRLEFYIPERGRILLHRVSLGGSLGRELVISILKDHIQSVNPLKVSKEEHWDI